MFSVKINKLRLLTTRDDIESILRDLILLGCVEVSEPDEFYEGTELVQAIRPESFSLAEYGANKDSLILLGTQYTLLLIGWVPDQSKPELVSMLSERVCAWEIVDPSPDEKPNVPVQLRCHWFFGELRLGSRRSFDPLTPL